jgi:hypothetical protein
MNWTLSWIGSLYWNLMRRSLGYQRKSILRTIGRDFQSSQRRFHISGESCFRFSYSVKAECLYSFDGPSEYNEKNAFTVEANTRDAMTKFLRRHMTEFTPNTRSLVIMSDVDEIPSGNTVQLLRTCNFGQSIHLQLRNYVYRYGLLSVVVMELFLVYLLSLLRIWIVSNGFWVSTAGVPAYTNGLQNPIIVILKAVMSLSLTLDGIAAIVSERFLNISPR